MSFFVYRSLTPHKKRIRLIDVLQEARPLPNEQNSLQQSVYQQSHASIVASKPICCTISHASLDNAPSYQALSYSWGDKNRRRDIMMDGGTLSITENLESALRHLRLHDRPLTLWIDALCIDQEDEVEKSEQIDQMRQIYAQASSVIAWLGPAARGSNMAMQWIQRFGSRAHELEIGSRPELYLEKLLFLFDSNKLESYDQDLRAFIAELQREFCQEENAKQIGPIVELDSLFKRPYWSRVWVVQELVSASQTVFVCGMQQVTEDALHHSTRLLRNFRQYHQVKFNHGKSPTAGKENSICKIDTSSPIVLIKFKRASGPFPLLYLLRNLRKFDATEPQDKVFALLGIASDATALGLSPDYKKLCQEVYTETARTLIRHGYYDILAMAGSSNRMACLPSWTPDWSTKLCRRPLQERSLDRSISPHIMILEPPFSASGVNEPHLPCMIEGKSNDLLLSLHGTIIGTVRRVGACWEDGAVGVWLYDLDLISREGLYKFETVERRQKSVWTTAVADQGVRQGPKKPRLSEEKLAAVHKLLEDQDLNSIKKDNFRGKDLGDYYQQLQAVAQDRRAFSITGGYYGIGPSETQEGDVLVILAGPQVPFILRRRSDESMFELVGEAFVDGAMDGELFKDALPMQVITLS